MRPITLVLIFLALFFAGTAAFVAKKVVSEKPPEVMLDEEGEYVKAEPMEKVLVAADDIELGSILTKKDLRWQKWPKAATTKYYVTGGKRKLMDEYIGTVAAGAFLKGEPVISRKVYNQDTAGFMAGQLSPGMRAMGIPVSKENGATGHISPGDRVDVIMTGQMSYRSESGGLSFGDSSKTVARDVRVLAIAEQTLPDMNKFGDDGKKKKKKSKGKDKLPKHVTLEVSPKQAEVLALATTVGELLLVLRPLAETEQDRLMDDAGISSEVTSVSDFNPSASRSTSSSMPSVSPVSRLTPSGYQGGVTVYRGGVKSVEGLR